MMDSIFLTNEPFKKNNFKKNENLIELIQELKQLLLPVQKEVQKKWNHLKYPVGLIIGAPRSGTTLMLQWLASTGHFAYPTNLLTRFAYAPYIGALIQKMLFDPQYDFHGEFFDIRSNLNFTSELGKSKGALATNEFHHFFRNYMPNFDPEYLNEEQLQKVDFTGMQQGLASIEVAFGKPFITKGMMLQYNLTYLWKKIPNIIFLFIRREPLFNIQSIYLARKKYYTNPEIWWSVKPKEYHALKDMDIYHQIAGQVYFTNRSIEYELEKIPDKNKVLVQYEDLCANPSVIYKKIVSVYKNHNYSMDENYSGVSEFQITNKIKIAHEEWKRFSEAYEDFEKGIIKL